MTSQPPSPQFLQAFVLGAGLGTRLKSLTERRPKPLVPVLEQPLMAHAFDHLIAAGVERFIVNTHHCAEVYGDTFPGASYQGCPIAFRHEPVLLETGGGMRNIADLAGDAPLLVYNGDIYATLPLAPAIEHHLASGNEITMILRSQGGAERNVGFRVEGECRGFPTGQLTDLRGRLGRDPGAYLFTGIYLISPSFFRRLPLEKISVVEPLLGMIEAGEPVGGIVLDEGEWWDLGTREQLLALHAYLRGQDAAASWVAPGAIVGDGVTLSGATYVGRGARIGEGAELIDSLVWPGAEVPAGARLCRCIVTGQTLPALEATDADF